MRSDKEKNYCSEIASRVSRIRTFLHENALMDPPDPAAWHSFLSELCSIQGNISNDGNFIATLLAKEYLQSKFSVDFDAADKPQGAPGIDIDVRTSEGQRVVAEIKTTVPYKASGFGGNQADHFKKDFAKLSASRADHKFLFVTDLRAFAFLKKEKYRKLMPGVRVVHLGTTQEYCG